MITEDYVSFETAKLLKKKGFNEDCYTCYLIDEIQHYDYKSRNRDLIEGVISAPTLQMAMKWLRLVYHIHIRLVNSTDESYRYEIYPRKGKYNSVCFTDGCYYETYEKAEEVAIKYSLENLI